MRMITVLESAEARETVFQLSVEFYHKAGRLGLIGEDVELLEGVLFGIRWSLPRKTRP